MADLLDLVNERDEIIGSCSKEDKCKDGSITRNVMVFLRDSQGNHILQVRSMIKKSWPGSYDPAACGDVELGETYQQAAHRELGEELGIQCTLRMVAKKRRTVCYKTDTRQVFTGFFLGVYNGDFSPNKEVDRVEKVPHENFERMISERAKGIEDYLVEEVAIMRSYWSV